MKQALIPLLFTASFYFASAQDSTITLSRFEKMATKQNEILRFQEKYVGSVRGQNVAVVKIVNFTNDDTSVAIKIAPANMNNTAIIGSSILYILKEDVQGIIKLLESYSTQVKNGAVLEGTYFSYITSNDVQFLCRQEETLFSSTYLTIGKLYQYLRTPGPFSAVSFSRKEIDQLIGILKEAANTL